MAVDYEALALEMGGKIVPDIDYDALALEMGGTVIPVVAPKLGSMETVEEIPGLEQPYPEPQPRPTMGEYATGAAETLGTMATGATTGLLGGVGGTVEGLSQAIMQGRFGTPEGARQIAEYAQRGMQAGTYEPRGRVAPEALKAIGEPLSQLPPVLGAGGLPTAGRAARAGAALPREVIQAGMERLPGAEGRAEVARSVGAAQTPIALQRRTVAEMMPVPFEGKAGLTLGQSSRDYAQLQFEKETAKLADIGQPLRERVEAQSANFIQNFDALVDLPTPIEREVRGIGAAVDQAIVNKAEIIKRKIKNEYKKADDAGETMAPARMGPLVEALNDLDRFSGVAKNIAAAKREAVRLGAIEIDDAGNIIPKTMTIKDAELLRQFVNKDTDWADKRQSAMARQINGAIDASTEGLGGQNYKDARNLRRKYSEEFENVGLTSRLLGKKGKTDERKIALEDVFAKIIVMSPLEEMNKLRRTLLTSGPDGKQAWADLKSYGIEYIKEKSFSKSQRDSRGNPLLSPDQLNKVVRAMDRSGKLESLYGTKIAQQLRDLAELATVIYTAPPGAINFSNTSSAIANAIDMMMTYGISGVPVAGKAVIKEALDYVKNKKIKARIKASLEAPQK
jgi:hypothetical protein